VNDILDIKVYCSLVALILQVFSHFLYLVVFTQTVLLL